MSRRANIGSPCIGLVVLAYLGCASSQPRDADICQVRGNGEAVDSALAVRACEQASDRFRLLFGVPAPAGQVVLIEGGRAPDTRTDGESWRFEWPIGRFFREVGTPLGITDEELDEFARSQWEWTVPHELGHVFLAAWLFPDYAPADAEAFYGTPLPDWFDEAVATWMEPDSVRADRLNQARAVGSGVPALRELLERTHPLAARHARDRNALELTRSVTRSCQGSCVGFVPGTTTMRYTIDAAGTVTVDTLRTAPPSPDERSADGSAASPADPVVTEFYALTYALLRFIHERGGQRAVRVMTERLKRGTTGTDAIRALPGLPADPATVEAQWMRWLDAAGDRTDGPSRGP